MTDDTPFGDYVVFVDESGDHGLASIDATYPVFVLVFCLFRIEDYVGRVVPAVQRFKFRHFGHDAVVLHERDIRKELGPFGILKPRSRKDAFMDELSDVIAAAPFRVVATIIRKEALRERYPKPRSPYDIALSFGLERIFYSLRRARQAARLTHVVVERRGQPADDELELEFRRVCDGANAARCRLPFALRMVDKRANSSGLQLADLIARPIGLSVLRPEQPNRAFDVLETKLDRDPRSGKVDGWGRKVFPSDPPERDEPRRNRRGSKPTG